MLRCSQAKWSEISYTIRYVWECGRCRGTKHHHLVPCLTLARKPDKARIPMTVHSSQWHECTDGMEKWRSRHRSLSGPGSDASPTSHGWKADPRCKSYSRTMSSWIWELQGIKRPKDNTENFLSVFPRDDKPEPDSNLFASAICDT